jgi:hypothetical protein
LRLRKKPVPPSVAPPQTEKKPRVAVPEFTIKRPGAKS